MSNKGAIFFYLFLFSSLVSAQECQFKLTGIVNDISTETPISYASIYIEETASGGYSDSLGLFEIDSLCEGKYHVFINHIGCETQELYLDISADTNIVVNLDHNSQVLNEIKVRDKRIKLTTEEIGLLYSHAIIQNMDKNLATMIENISGVSAIKNGSGIGIPVVHGLYGNRVTILNNGIAQSGQQWGVDHSPEIDPLVANTITVIKGVGAIEYQGNSLGSIVLVQPKKINGHQHLHGEGRYFFESNGLGHGLNLELQQSNKYIDWHVIGTIKKNGDNHTSRYFLRNTGGQQANIAVQLEKKAWHDRIVSNLYFSSYNAEIGILRGSHISNLTDLEDALNRDIPFYTEDNFSYTYDAPYQKVNHQLLKFHTSYSHYGNAKIDFTYAGQYNLRKEFDVRRSGRSEDPALSLEQFSNFFELKYQNNFIRQWKIKTGIQVTNVDNANLPETGILPLIPDYISSEYGIFSTFSNKRDRIRWELGGRYDIEERNVATISSGVPAEIVRYGTNFGNVSGMFGIKYDLKKGWNAAYNIGYAIRNPEVNELYSNGLHQGVSGIEEGDPLLDHEVSLKNTLSIKGKIFDGFYMSGLFYHQQIDDYIYLKPQDEIRLTIRGAFPVFRYEQTDAQLLGFDINSTYHFSHRFNIVAKYSFVEGTDLSNDLPLIYMPSNNLFVVFNHHNIPRVGKFQDVGLQLNGRYVFEQKNIQPEQDFVAPPEAYYLIGLKLSAAIQYRSIRTKMFVKVENLLNETYRDYLNRQRYFADDLGFNLVTGVSVSF